MYIIYIYILYILIIKSKQIKYNKIESSNQKRLKTKLVCICFVILIYSFGGQINRTLLNKK